MNLTYLAALVAVPTYWKLRRGILSGDTPQNFTTWILWGILDSLAAVTIFQGHGSWVVAAAYGVGSATMAFSILKTQPITWNWLDSLIVVMIAICLVIWKNSGNYWGTIAFTSASIIAGVTQLEDLWKHPEESPITVYRLFMITNILGVVGAKSWTVEERFYPVMCTFLTITYLSVISYRLRVHRQ